MADIDKKLSKLKSADASERMKAVTSLMKVEDKKVIKALLDVVITDSDKGIRAGAASNIAIICAFGKRNIREEIEKRIKEVKDKAALKILKDGVKTAKSREETDSY